VLPRVTVADEDRREIEYKGRPVVIRGGEKPLREWRGFFSGDEYDPHGAHAEAAAAEASKGAPGHADVTIEYRGEIVGLHRTTSGKLHSHDLPTLLFSSVEEAAETVARLIDEAESSGTAQEPEQP
jgi:hypothetical protein